MGRKRLRFFCRCFFLMYSPPPPRFLKKPFSTSPSPFHTSFSPLFLCLRTSFVLRGGEGCGEGLSLWRGEGGVKGGARAFVPERAATTIFAPPHFCAAVLVFVERGARSLVCLLDGPTLISYLDDVDDDAAAAIYRRKQAPTSFLSLSPICKYVLATTFHLFAALSSRQTWRGEADGELGASLSF